MYNHAKFLKIAQEVINNGEFPTIQSEMNSSIPGHGPNNIMLQGGTGEGMVQNNASPVAPNVAPTVNEGADPEEVMAKLNELATAGPQEAQGMKQIITDLAQQMKTPEYADSLRKIVNAIEVNSDPNKQTINLQTNEKDPTAQELAKQLAERIKTDMNQKDTQSANTMAFNLQKYIVAAKEEKPKPADEKEKKKTRGNPFRVLMGQVGKLLDHGMSKKDIVKYLLRQKHWNEDTIGKAVDIVKDYNRKKRTKKEEASSSFNLARYAAFQKEDKWFEPDWAKRSTSELFARASWLRSLQDFNQDDNHNEGRKAADTTDASSELKAIRSALKKRGFDDSELP